MPALPKSDTDARHRRLNRSKAKSPTAIASPQQQLPTALQVLLSFQQATSLITLGIVGVVLGIYGWTVYTPLQWSQAYQQLKTLQKTERQLIVNTEAIKHQLAQEADRPNSGLVNPSPDQNIFLPTKQSDLIASKVQHITANHPSLSLTVKPIAY